MSQSPFSGIPEIFQEFPESLFSEFHHSKNMLLHPLSLPVLCIILICALLTVLQLFPAKTVNCQVSGYFSKKNRQNCRFSGWYRIPCSQPCIIDAFIGVFLIIQNIPAILKQYLLYFSSVACMAFSDLSKYKLIITVSSTFSPHVSFFAFIR